MLVERTLPNFNESKFAYVENGDYHIIFKRLFGRIKYHDIKHLS